MSTKDIKINDINQDVISLIKEHIEDQSLEDIKATLLNALSSNHVKLFVLYDQNKPVGFCYGNLSVGLESKGYYFWINEFFIKSTHREQGFGHLLMTHVKEKLKEDHVRYVALVTSKVNDQAKAFFKKEGFHEQDYLWLDYIAH